jgi:hypothetical protein
MWTLKISSLLSANARNAGLKKKFSPMNLIGRTNAKAAVKPLIFPSAHWPVRAKVFLHAEATGQTVSARSEKGGLSFGSSKLTTGQSDESKHAFGSGSRNFPFHHG